LFWLVGESSLRKDEQQHCRGEREEEGCPQTIASKLRCRQEAMNIVTSTIAGIQRCVQEDRDEDATLLTRVSLGDYERWLINTVAYCNKRSVDQGEFLNRFVERFFMR
jgi:hypothetical protein